ncbi:MAG: hypothetical protein C4529_11000 [Deltaproteobacteria bacterium]|nr:MAG: hypothetical protein C4529_11000 [Deltaproteobacteria bacterium]
MRPGFRVAILSLLAGFSLAIAWQQPACARETATDLRREKARLIEMKAREEKTAAELLEALRREKLSKERVGELQERLKKQKRSISRIDRKLSALGERLDRTEKEVRELVAAQEQARGAARRAAFAAFAGDPSRSGEPADPSMAERERYFMRVHLGADMRDMARLTKERERKQEELAGIEKQVAASERSMAREKKVGESLLSRQESERKRLADIEKEKKGKQKELRALRAKIARMEAVVSRVERQAKERDRRRRKKEPRGTGGVASPPEAPKPPGRFASLAGGLSSPLPGRVVSRFGKQHDPTFDVTIENRGVEIEGPSGAPVKSVARGEVAFAGAVSGFGNVLILQHGTGLFSVYGKLERFAVKQGEEVPRGAVVGRLQESPSGKSVLYLEMRAGGTAIDPASVIPLNR